MVVVDLWKTSSERTGESDAHIVESQNYPLDIGNGAREGFLVDFLLNLPVVAVPHAHTPRTSKIVTGSVTVTLKIMLTDSRPFMGVSNPSLRW